MAGVGTYSIDGILLDDPARRWLLEKATVLPAGANRRVTLVELPSIDGGVPVTQGMGYGTVTVSVAVLPTALLSLDALLSAVRGVLANAKVLSRRDSLGVELSTDVVQVVIAEPVLRGSAATISAVLTTQPFWRAATVLTTTAKTLTTGANTPSFPEFSGCTGKLADAIIRMRGPFTSLQVTSPVDGSGFIAAQTLTSAQYLFIRLADFRAWISTSATDWDGAGTALLLDYPAAGRLQLWPSSAADPLSRPVSLKVALTGAGANTGIVLQGRRHFL